MSFCHNSFAYNWKKSNVLNTLACISFSVLNAPKRDNIWKLSSVNGVAERNGILNLSLQSFADVVGAVLVIHT